MSPRINVKLDEVESGFTVVPDARYLIEIQESSKIRKSSDTGGLYIGWIGVIQEGEFADKRLYWMTSLVDAALWNVKSLLEVIGVEWDEDGFELDDTYGATLYVDVISQEWPKGSGEFRNRVNGYAPAN